MKIFIQIAFSLLWLAGLGINQGRAQLYNTNYGTYAGDSLAVGDGSYNANFGYKAGMENIDGSNNSYLGAYAGYHVTGSNNSIIGGASGSNLYDGDGNTFLGTYAGYQLEEGSYNTLIGQNTGLNMTSGDGNVMLGRNAGYLLTSGDNNVFIGRGAGLNNETGSANVFIGYLAGGASTLADESNILVIENSIDLSHPLIYGDFENDKLGIATSNLVAETTLTVAGNVHIGAYGEEPTVFASELADDYLLWVEKGIATEDLAITDVGDWSDFVFDDDYDLRTLDELAAYIKTHGHLPDMPSAEEVKSKGYSIHDINRKLLQKVEELVLYTLEREQKLTVQQQQNLAQQKELASQEDQLATIMTRLARLENETQD